MKLFIVFNLHKAESDSVETDLSLGNSILVVGGVQGGHYHRRCGQEEQQNK